MKGARLLLHFNRPLGYGIRREPICNVRRATDSGQLGYRTPSGAGWQHPSLSSIRRIPLSPCPRTGRTGTVSGDPRSDGPDRPSRRSALVERARRAALFGPGDPVDARNAVSRAHARPHRRTSPVVLQFSPSNSVRSASIDTTSWATTRANATGFRFLGGRHRSRCKNAVGCSSVRLPETSSMQVGGMFISAYESMKTLA